VSRVVGFDELSYNHEKSIYGVAVEGFRFEKVQRIPVERLVPRSAFRAAASMMYLPFFPVRQIAGRRRSLSLRRPDLYHVWNRIPVSRSPWAVTFESYLPRIVYGASPRAHDWAKSRLASEDCRSIIAISNMALRTFQRDHPTLAECVKSKLHVLYPAQLSFLTRTQLDAKMNRKRDAPLRALFVGHDFFRKGGAAVIAAAKELTRKSIAVHFEIVSRVDSGDYVTAATSSEASTAIREMNASLSISLNGSLSTDRLSAMMEWADVLLLPTLDDTFGYVAIEAMARGTPVISTDVRALPEINPSNVGWQLHLPRGTDYPEHWSGIDAPAGSAARRHLVAAATQDLANQLVERLTILATHEDELRTKTLNAHSHAVSHFSPATHAAGRLAIYKKALEHA